MRPHPRPAGIRGTRYARLPPRAQWPEGPLHPISNRDRIMPRNEQKRRRWLVHPRYQLRFALGLVVLNLSVGFLYQVTLHYRMQELARRAGSLDAFLETDPWVSIWPAMVVATFFSALVVFYIGIRYSHQIVGPLPRISRTLSDLASGENPVRLQVRSGDVLNDVVLGINRVADALHPSGAPPEVASPRPGRQRRTREEQRVHAASILGPSRDRETADR
jgi:hypothetical protein